MTGGERADLKIALDFLHEWRADDKEWKDRTDKRLWKLETRAVAHDAVSGDQDRRKADRKWRFGLLIGLGGSLAVSVVNLFTK